MGGNIYDGVLSFKKPPKITGSYYVSLETTSSLEIIVGSTTYKNNDKIPVSETGTLAVKVKFLNPEAYTVKVCTYFQYPNRPIAQVKIVRTESFNHNVLDSIIQETQFENAFTFDTSMVQNTETIVAYNLATANGTLTDKKFQVYFTSNDPAMKMIHTFAGTNIRSKPTFYH